MVSAFAASLATTSFIEVWSDSFWFIMSITGFICSHILFNTKSERRSCTMFYKIVSMWLHGFIYNGTGLCSSRCIQLGNFAIRKNCPEQRVISCRQGQVMLHKKVIITIISALITSSLVDDSWNNFETDAWRIIHLSSFLCVAVIQWSFTSFRP